MFRRMMAEEKKDYVSSAHHGFAEYFKSFSWQAEVQKGFSVCVFTFHILE